MTTVNFTDYAGQAVGGEIAQRLPGNKFSVNDLAEFGNLVRAAGSINPTDPSNTQLLGRIQANAAY